MAQGFHIVEHDIGCGHSVMALAKDGKGDFLDKLASKPKDTQRLKLILRTAEHIEFFGPKSYMRPGGTIRPLDGELSLVEIKVPGKVIRVMAYLKDPFGSYRLVLLFDFDGHQGSGKIPENIMERGRRLAAIARETLEED